MSGAPMMLPGWFCQGCRGFNGEAKARLEVCRACGAARPAILGPEEARNLAVFVLAGQPPKSYVEAAVQFAALIENGTQTHRTFSNQ